MTLCGGNPSAIHEAPPQRPSNAEAFHSTGESFQCHDVILVRIMHRISTLLYYFLFIEADFTHILWRYIIDTGGKSDLCFCSLWLYHQFWWNEMESVNHLHFGLLRWHDRVIAPVPPKQPTGVGIANNFWQTAWLWLADALALVNYAQACC